MNIAADVGGRAVIDMRSRPPLPEFRAYFDPDRLAAPSARSGADGVPRAFAPGVKEKVLGRNALAVMNMDG
jgi:hypothetical protein